jgi:CDP-glucose 4,6-dehydratase
MNPNFWKQKKVLITGHTGFKGSWMSLWLQELGATVVGYSNSVPTDPSLFKVANVEEDMKSIVADVRDLNRLKEEVSKFEPEIVIHMAAQSLVQVSYDNPVETFSTNVMGTVNLFEAIKTSQSTKVVINVTSDKCYEEMELDRGFKETDPLGGYDPYSSSKGCSELVTSSYRNSFFNKNKNSNVVLASVRAGNVIGGGDWAKNRIIPDAMRAFANNEKLLVRNPNSIRPWQHVLEPLFGYLILCQQLINNPTTFSGAWNFGPNYEDTQPVSVLADIIVESWGGDAEWGHDNGEHPYEANYLKLDCTKAKTGSSKPLIL